MLTLQRSGQSLTVHCQVVWNDMDLGMVTGDLSVS